MPDGTRLDSSGVGEGMKDGLAWTGAETEEAGDEVKGSAEVV